MKHVYQRLCRSWICIELVNENIHSTGSNSDWFTFNAYVPFIYIFIYSNRIIKLQKRCVRIITRSTYNAHTQPLMKQLNILSVPDMLLLNSMKFYYKYKRNELPDYFTSFNLHTQGSTHDYNTRQGDDIRTNRVRINLTEKCLRNYLPKTINSTPNQIFNRIDTHSMEGFAFTVKYHLISKYGLVCQNESCYVCQRQPRSWCVNRLLPVNHCVHISPFIDILFLTAHFVY